MEDVKSTIISEFNKILGYGHIEDVTISRLLDLSEMNIDCSKVIIFDIRIKLEQITLKLISHSEDFNNIHLSINNNNIGIIENKDDIGKNIMYIIKLFKSIL